VGVKKGIPKIVFSLLAFRYWLVYRENGSIYAQTCCLS